MARVFVNYRTASELKRAVAVERGLSTVFGGLNVPLASSSRFEGRRLHDRWRADALVAVIGPGWHGIADARGGRCLDDPADWTRREIAEALGRGVLVVPLLVDGAQRLGREELPAELAGLTRCSWRRSDGLAGLAELVDRLARTPARAAR
jgi:hypothetical protein